MAFQKRHRRMGWLGLCAVLVVLGGWIVLTALKDNAQFFYNASDVAAENFTPQSDPFRVGGVVAPGSVKTEGIRTTFQVVDFEREMPAPLTVSYEGALPDLFREGEGVVVAGSLVGPREIIANEVLAKHDENYQPKANYLKE